MTVSHQRKSHQLTVQNTYLILMLLNTLAASFIWGINTLFLLDAGLSNAQAFAANAFFTAGQVLFEIPTGVIADTWGRRASYLLGVITLMGSTLLYLYMWQISGPFWGWAVSSMLLGLGFTFFSGATEAWLVDALHATGFTGQLESVFAKGQIVGGVAMLSGSVLGGVLAQQTNLGVPYIVRSAVLLLSFAVAFVLMKDLGFTPRKSTSHVQEMKLILQKSVKYGIRKPEVRWVMLAAPFSAGVGFFAFYAMQPYLLELYGNNAAYGVAGLAAAIVAGAQIVGGLSVKYIRRIFKRRTSALLASVVCSAAILCAIGLAAQFWVVIVLLVLWGLVFAATSPIRQAYLNGLIPSEQRATVLSFDSLIGSVGGVVFQPALGKSADLWSYGTSYVVSGGIQILAAPFIIAARRLSPVSDVVQEQSAESIPTEVLKK
ncbi:MAG TPA: MFS transporter [Verrucomicrobiae bacterium]|nr:MFS transporter [Verrucomicrobiae bacterium]